MQVSSIYGVTERKIKGFDFTVSDSDASVKAFDDKTQQRAIWNKDAIYIILSSSNSR